MNRHRKGESLPAFECRGTRASVALHEEHLRRFLASWERARSSGVGLKPVDDPDYTSYDALLRHLFHWARRYLLWICEQLDLPAPKLGPPLELGLLADESADYLETLLAAWRTPLRGVPAERVFREVHTAPWGIPYSIDAMLEHAVMHPVKHRFQLEELMGER